MKRKNNRSRGRLHVQPLRCCCCCCCCCNSSLNAGTGGAGEATNVLYSSINTININIQTTSPPHHVVKRCVYTHAQSLVHPNISHNRTHIFGHNNMNPLSKQIATKRIASFGLVNRLRITQAVWTSSSTRLGSCHARVPLLLAPNCSSATNTQQKEIIYTQCEPSAVHTIRTLLRPRPTTPHPTTPSMGH